MYKKLSFLLSILMIMLLFASHQSNAITIKQLVTQAQERQENYNREIKDITFTEKTTITARGKEVSTSQTVMRKGNKFRSEQNHGKTKTITINDGKETWVISPIMGKIKTPEQNSMRNSKQKWFQMLEENAQITGSEEINGKDCHIIKISEPENSNSIKIWLDKDSFQTVKQEIESENITFYYSVFRKVVNGWEHPYKTKVYKGKELLSSSVIQSLKVNQGLSDDLFNPDKVVLKYKKQNPSFNPEKAKDLQQMMKKMYK